MYWIFIPSINYIKMPLKSMIYGNLISAFLVLLGLRKRLRNIFTMKAETGNIILNLKDKYRQLRSCILQAIIDLVFSIIWTCEYFYKTLFDKGIPKWKICVKVKKLNLFNYLIWYVLNVYSTSRSRLFKTAFISILLCGCESWLLTEALIEKLYIFARTCYRNMLFIKQSRSHVTYESL